jgi:hypothetical protein
LLLLCFVGFDSFSKVTAEFTSQEFLYQVELPKRIFKESGEFVRTVSNPTDLVMTRWGLISYDADRPYVVLPKGDVAEVVGYGRKSGVKYLVIDTISVESRRGNSWNYLTRFTARRSIRVMASRCSAPTATMVLVVMWSTSTSLELSTAREDLS